MRFLSVIFFYMFCLDYVKFGFVWADDDDSDSSDESEEQADRFSNVTYMSRLMDYVTFSNVASPLHRNVADVEIEVGDEESSEPGEGGPEPKEAADSPADSTEKEDDDKKVDDLGKVFDKYKGEPYNPDDYDRRLREILFTPDPLYGTDYNREWGRGCLTEDGEVPSTEFLVHFDVFDPFTPPGLDFEDLRCLHLYNIERGYSLYKLRMGDMIVTLRPDLKQVAVHLFEDYWGQMVVRLLYTWDGALSRHEWTEQGRGSKTFHKTMGPAVHYNSPDIETKDLNKWLDEKYRVLSELRPPIIEEVMQPS